MTSVAMGVGSPRVVQGKEIVNLLGNANINPEAEKKVRAELVAKALEALQTEVKDSTLFEVNKQKE